MKKTRSDSQRDESTPGAGLLLACVPTALLLLCNNGAALADDYFDPAALELSDPQQQMADLHYFEKAGGQQPGYGLTIRR